MKLTLSVSGGFTGLTKEETIELGSLDEKTRTSLLQYFEEKKPPSLTRGVTETWVLNDKEEIEVDVKKLPPELKSLYSVMKKSLTYKKNK